MTAKDTASSSNNSMFFYGGVIVVIALLAFFVFNKKSKLEDDTTESLDNKDKPDIKDKPDDKEIPKPKITKCYERPNDAISFIGFPMSGDPAEHHKNWVNAVRSIGYSDAQIAAAFAWSRGMNIDFDFVSPDKFFTKYLLKIRQFQKDFKGKYSEKTDYKTYINGSMGLGDLICDPDNPIESKLFDGLKLQSFLNPNLQYGKG
jgi:hypothetical protein